MLYAVIKLQEHELRYTLTQELNVIVLRYVVLCFVNLQA